MSNVVRYESTHRVAVLTVDNPPGFPRHRGGPMFYADTVGLPVVLARIEEYRGRLGDHWVPAPRLERLAAAGRGFYSEAS